METPAADSSGGDRYRSHLAGEGEKHTVWRHGAPPSYDAVNALFEAERTQVHSFAARAGFSSSSSFHTRTNRAGVAGGVAGGDRAERDQDVGDGAVAQGAAVGLQVREPRQVQAVRERRSGPERGGDAGRGQLQRAAGQPAPGARGRVRRLRRDVPVLARPVPRRVPARLRVGGAQGLLRPAAARLQVPALGPQGGALQGPRRHRRQGRVLRRRRA
jgi:hypothetical protein